MLIIIISSEHTRGWEGNVVKFCEHESVDTWFKEECEGEDLISETEQREGKNDFCVWVRSEYDGHVRYDFDGEEGSSTVREFKKTEMEIVQ